MSDDPRDDQRMVPDEASFRTVLGHFATGVTIVTAWDGEAVGMAANAFTSVSIDPPLVLFCASKSSTTWPRIEKAGAFTVNVLSEHQEDVCRVFATRGADRFSRVGWRPASTGAPVLHDALAYMDCRTEAVHDGGDHMIVVGRVLELGVLQDSGPLVFYRGGYGRFAV